MLPVIDVRETPQPWAHVAGIEELTEPDTFDRVGLTRMGDAYLLDFVGIPTWLGRTFEISSLETHGSQAHVAMQRVAGDQVELEIDLSGIDGLVAGQRTLDPRIITGIQRSGLKIRHWEEIQIDFIPDGGGGSGDDADGVGGSPDELLDIDLPLLRVHCPRNKGCKATYSAVTSGSAGVSATVNFFGVNGGAGYELTWSATEAFDADDQSCTEVVVKARVRLEIGTIKISVPRGFHDAHGKGPHVDTIANAIYFSIEDVDMTRTTPRALPREFDHCEWELKRVARYPRWPGGSDTLRDKVKSVILERARHISGRIGVGLSLQKFPVSFGVDFQADTTHQDVIKTQLTTGARYLPYSPNMADDPAQRRFFEVCWTTK